MTQKFDFSEFLSRSTDRPFAETTLAKILYELPRLGPSGPWIAGGALRRTIGNKEPDSDFDFFFRNEDQLEKFAENLDEKEFKRVNETEHHVQYSGQIADAQRIIQLIKFRYYENTEDVIDSFDFTICQFVFDGAELTCGDFSLWNLGRRRLAIHKISFPLSTMRRVLKYGSQGFIACGGALTQILTATSNNPSLLEQMHIQYVD